MEQADEVEQLHDYIRQLEHRIAELEDQRDATERQEASQLDWHDNLRADWNGQGE